MWKQHLWKEITVYEYLKRLEPFLVQELKGHSFENLLGLGLLIHKYQSFILHMSILCVCLCEH